MNLPRPLAKKSVARIAKLVILHESEAMGP
jgi:hypothetical protein